MAKFGLRGVVAMAAFAMLSNAGPSVAQKGEKNNTAPRESKQFCPGVGWAPIGPCPEMPAGNKTCPGGQVIPANQACPIPNNHKLCFGGKSVPADQVCPPPPPETSRCPDKTVVRYQAACPTSESAQNRSVQTITPPSPKDDPSHWVLQFGYPSDALRVRAEGVVGYRLNVGPDGKPTQCQVAESSGNDSLDWATCENLMRRASFDSAKDKNGKPLASTYSSRVRWTPPRRAVQSSGSIPRSYWGPDFISKLTWKASPVTVRIYVVQIVDANGKTISCDVSATVTETWGEKWDLADENKNEFCANAIKPLQDKDGKPATTRVEFSFDIKNKLLQD